MSAREWLTCVDEPLLMVISDPVRRGSLPLLSTLQRAAEAGAQLIQLRDKTSSTTARWKLARELAKQLPSSCHLVINDRVDIAMAVGASGVHLPESGLPVHVIRKMIGPGCLIGCSVHSLESACRAEEAGADYLQVGTMFSTSCKPGKEPEGPPLLRRIRERVGLPLFGVGGVTPQNARRLVEIGASGVAVVSYVTQSDAPDERVKALLEAISPGA